MTTKRTNKVEPRRALLAAVEEISSRPFLILAWRTTPPDYRVELAQLEDNVGQEFLSHARRAAARLSEAAYIAYDPEWLLRDHEYFALAKDEFPSTNLFDKVSDFQQLLTFHRRNLTKPKLYVVAVQSSGEVALFGKRMAYLQVLKQKPGVFAAVWDGSTFNALGDSVATFSAQFDWILWREVLYILDAGSFHAEFRDLVALRDAVAAHVASISTRVGIVNADAMIARCQSNVQMASKLKRISERGLQLTSTPAQLMQYAKDYGIGVAWQGNQLVFDGSLEGQWNILKLLDEDRTEGPITHRHYESAAKREV